MRIFTMAGFAIAMMGMAMPVMADLVPSSGLEMQIASRDGNTFVLDVTNPSDSAAKFDSVGLYFLPDPRDGEPQRLGVVTSGEVAANGQWRTAAGLVDVAPHQSVRVRLTSYCLDSHRESPAENVRYHVASKRMPYALMTALAGAAQTSTNAPVRRPSPQEEEMLRDRDVTTYSPAQLAIWAVRDATPTLLLGEGHIAK